MSVLGTSEAAATFEVTMCELNTATVEQLAALPRVGLRAYELMLWRPFLNWKEVERVPGFDRVTVQAIRRAGASLWVPGVVAWPRAG